MLGDIAGAPGKLPYSKEVYEYMRLLAKAMPNRVKVFSIGTTEEGREHIAVAIASDALMAKYEENARKLAKLADPRTINMNDKRGRARSRNVAAPVYYITGTIHSTEAGAPTALMELAYRLAVDDSALHKEHPRPRYHAHHADRRGRRTRSRGGRLQLEEGASGPGAAER